MKYFVNYINDIPDLPRKLECSEIIEFDGEIKSNDDLNKLKTQLGHTGKHYGVFITIRNFKKIL